MSVKRLSRSDRSAVIEVLTAAFWDYPVMRFVLGDAEDGYAARLEPLISFFVEKRLTRSWPILGTMEDDRLAAVALVNEPGDLPATQELERWIEELRRTVGEEAFARFKRYETETDLDAPVGPFHYLGMIGVHPEFQGKGHARQLVDELHRMAAAHPDSTGVCLSTEVPANVRLYEHLGYEIVAERDIEDLRTWCMFRPNQGSEL